MLKRNPLNFALVLEYTNFIWKHVKSSKSQHCFARQRADFGYRGKISFLKIDLLAGLRKAATFRQKLLPFGKREP